MGWVGELKLDIKYFPRKMICKRCEERAIENRERRGAKALLCSICAEEIKSEKTKERNEYAKRYITIAKKTKGSMQDFTEYLFNKYDLKFANTAVDRNSYLSTATKIAKSKNMTFIEFVKMIEAEYKKQI